MNTQPQLDFCSGGLQPGTAEDARLKAASTAEGFALDARARLEARVRELEESPPAGLWERDLEILRFLASCGLGRANARPAAAIVTLLDLPRGEAGRRIVAKAIYRLKRLGAVPIGAARGKPNGYFLMLTDDDEAQGTAPFEHQLLDGLKTLRRIRGSDYVARFLRGQLDLFEQSAPQSPEPYGSGQRTEAA